MTRDHSGWVLAAVGALGVVLTAHAAQTLEPGTDRPGGDLRPGFEMATADPALCQQACEAEPACKGYTYVRPGVQGPTARCWLKAEIRPPVKNECCVSGVKLSTTKLATQPAGLAPIPLPGPTGAAATPGGVAVAKANLPGSLPLPPLPPDLSKLTAPMTRQTMIQTLELSPVASAAIANVAAAAGVTTESIASAPLPDSGAGAAASAAESRPPPQEFLDLWKSPVRCSPTRPGPAYAYGGTTSFVSITYFKGITQFNFRGDLERMLQTEVLSFAPEAEIWVYLDLPPGGGQYVLAVHIVDTYGKSVSPLNQQVVIGSVFGLGSKVGGSELSFVPNSDGTALVALFAESPQNEGVTPGPDMQMRHQSVLLRLFTQKHAGYYAGVTVTRL